MNTTGYLRKQVLIIMNDHVDDPSLNVKKVC